MVHLQLGEQSYGVYTGPHDFDPAGDKVWEINISATLTGSSLLGVGDDFSGEDVLIEPASLKEETWYTSRIVANGNQYEWFIDNQPMWKFEGKSVQLTYGAVGLYTRNCEARFDDVIITGETIPEIYTITSVSSGDKLATLWGQIKISQ